MVVLSAVAKVVKVLRRNVQLRRLVRSLREGDIIVTAAAAAFCVGPAYVLSDRPADLWGPQLY